MPVDSCPTATHCYMDPASIFSITCLYTGGLLWAFSRLKQTRLSGFLTGHVLQPQHAAGPLLGSLQFGSNAGWRDQARGQRLSVVQDMPSWEESSFLSNSWLCPFSYRTRSCWPSLLATPRWPAPVHIAISLKTLATYPQSPYPGNQCQAWTVAKGRGFAFPSMTGNAWLCVLLLLFFPSIREKLGLKTCKMSLSPLPFRVVL